MYKYKFNINNLDCANCANNLEKELNNNPLFKNVTVNFSTSKITFNSKTPITLENLNKLIQEIEPDSYASEITNNNEEISANYTYFILAILSFIISLFIKNIYIKEILIAISYILLLSKISIKALKILFKNHSIDENFLITISCLGAYILNEKIEGLMVITLYTIGKILESKAINNSRKSIKELMDLKQDYANLKKANEIVKINVEDIKINDILIVKKGEKIPVDGIVLKGNTLLDTSSLTGEQDLIRVNKNSKVLSSSINTDHLIEIKTTTTYNNSTTYKILELVEEATNKKAKTETFINHASRIYTPIILILALATIIILPLLSIPISTAIYRALTFLIIACPCAIVISIPLSYFTAIGIASKNGILIKGSNSLDSLRHTNKIIFDKTGTLTNGNFQIKDLIIVDNKYTKEELMRIVCAGESLSNHPLAQSIINFSKQNFNNKDIKNFIEITGQGISYQYQNLKVLIGNNKLCKCKDSNDIHININKKHVASLVLSDNIKKEAKETIHTLHQKNIVTYMFTGDKKIIANTIGQKLHINNIKAQMLPNDKYKSYEDIKKANDTIIFVGDGINDAPVLKRADIGISMGIIGGDAAIEAADIVLMSDDLSKIPLAIEISTYTNHIIIENLIFAITIKILILILSIFGLTNMWFAVFADTGVTLLTILNTLRIYHKFYPKKI